MNEEGEQLEELKGVEVVYHMHECVLPLLVCLGLVGATLEAKGVLAKLRVCWFVSPTHHHDSPVTDEHTVLERLYVRAGRTTTACLRSYRYELEPPWVLMHAIFFRQHKQDNIQESKN